MLTGSCTNERDGKYSTTFSFAIGLGASMVLHAVNNKKLRKENNV
jgi:hypothetical protein